MGAQNFKWGIFSPEFCIFERKYPDRLKFIVELPPLVTTPLFSTAPIARNSKLRTCSGVTSILKNAATDPLDVSKNALFQITQNEFLEMTRKQARFLRILYKLITNSFLKPKYTHTGPLADASKGAQRAPELQ